MSMEEEIKKRLYNEDNDFLTSLEFGIKLWKSPNFYYMSKYEIITGYVCDNLSKFYKSIRQMDDAEFDEKWEIVNDFLCLECPLSALSKKQQIDVTTAIQKVGSKSSKKPRRTILESFLIIATHQKYKNYYKYDLKMYGETLKSCLVYYTNCLKDSSRDVNKEDETIKRILNDVNLYVKSDLNTAELRDTFYQEILTDLSKVVLLLKNINIDCHDDLLKILQDLYFTDNNCSTFTKVPAGKKHLLMGHFDISMAPIHVTAVLIEGFLVAYKTMKTDILRFAKYIFEHLFIDVEESLLKDIQEIFTILTYFFHVLKKNYIKFEQTLLQEYNFTSMIPQKLDELVEQYSSSDECLCEIFGLVCTINEYNPLILENSIIKLVLKSMFIKKSSQKTIEKFQDLLVSTIDLFSKINRKESFRVNLFSELTDYLEENNLNKKIAELRKSSLKRSKNDGETSGKKLKLENGNSSMIDPENIDDDYVKLLYKNESKNQPKPINHNLIGWKEISFAWPDHNGKLSNAMIEYVAFQRSRLNFNYWFTLKEYLDDIYESIENDLSESHLFKLDLLCCFICYFFAGNTMVEQSNLFWDKLQNEFNNFDECLNKLGSLIIKMGDCGRLMNAFLKMSYFYGNFRMIVHYYRPDTIEMDETASDIHQYLSDDKWALIETKIEAENRLDWNRINLQKLKFRQLINHAEAVNNDLIEKIPMNDFPQIKSILLDRSTNFWFVKLLNKDQKIAVSDFIIDNINEIENVQYILKNTVDDHEFIVIFLISVFKNIATNILKSSNNSLMAQFKFDGIYELDEDEVLGKVRKLIKKKFDDKTVVEVDESNLKRLHHLLNVLNSVTINEITVEHKNIIIGLNILMFCDLKLVLDETAVQLNHDLLMAQIKFGKCPDIMKYFDINLLLVIFNDVVKHKLLLQTLFLPTIYTMTPSTLDNLNNLLTQFKEGDSRNLFKIVLIVYEFLTKANATKMEHIDKEELTKMKLDYTNAIEAELQKQIPDKVSKKNMDMFNDCLYGLTVIIRFLKTFNSEFTAETKELFKKYIAKALLISNIWSTVFLTSTLLYKDHLSLEKEMIDEIVENRWVGLKDVIRRQICENSNEEMDAIENAVRTLHVDPIKTITDFVINIQDRAVFEQRLKVLEGELNSDSSLTHLKYVLRMYSTLSKRGFNKINVPASKVLSTSVENIFDNHIQPLCVMKKFFEDPTCLEEILNCYATLIQNPKVNLSSNLMDNVLAFLASINIKKYNICEGEEKAFYKLNRQIGEILSVMIVHRPGYVINRLPHYLNVFTGLLASIICYKDDRKDHETLENAETLALSNLLHPLEKTMNFLVRHGKDVKSLAPYTLSTIIHQMITSKRSTTLHQKIKHSINNICYELIGIYDRHVPSYFLRASDEAAKNVFTDLVKNYEKYRSFKGKI